jgi:hypothetical protein
MRLTRIPFLHLAILSLASIATTQGKTWIVDARGGTGVFTDIQEAVDAAAASGDTILVRKGDYSGILIARKAITILADDGARVAKGVMQGLIVYSGVKGARTLIRGLRFAATVPAQITIVSSPGVVFLDGIVMSGSMKSCDFTGAGLVHIERCTMQGTVMFQGETTGVIVDSECRGVSGPSSTSGKQSPAILANLSTGGTLQISASTIVGADAVSAKELPGAAIEAGRGVRITIRGSATDRIAAGKGVLPRAAIIGAYGGGELALDPRVPVVGNGTASGVNWQGTVTSHKDATLTSSAGAIGSTLDLEVRAESGAIHLVLAGIPVLPVQVSPFGDLGLAPFMVVTSGGGGTTRHRFRIPNDQKLRGVVVGWQVVGSLPNQLPRLGNVSVTTIR